MHNRIKLSLASPNHISIASSSLEHIFQKNFQPRSLRLNYVLALFFGLIHGLGFANTIRFAMAKDQSMGWSLFGFNIGLEAGQIVVVLGILLLSYLLVNIIMLKRRWWVWGLSWIALVWAVKMAVERWPG